MSMRPWIFLLATSLILPVHAQPGEAGRGGTHGGAPDSRSRSGTERDDLMVHVQRAMEELKAAVQQLAKRAEKASGEAKAALDQQLRALREEQKQLEMRLDALRAATAQQWKQLHEEIDRALEELRRSDSTPKRDTI